MESNDDYHARIRGEISNSMNSYLNSDEWKSTLAYWHDKLQQVNSMQSEIKVQPVRFHSNYVQIDQNSLGGQDLPLNSNAKEVNSFVPIDEGLQYEENDAFKLGETTIAENEENLVNEFPAFDRNTNRIVSFINPHASTSNSNRSEVDRMQQSQNGSNVKSSEQVVNQESTLESGKKKIPTWSKLDPNVRNVNFIEKPLHLRSTTPLRRIIINQLRLMGKESHKDKLVENVPLKTSTASSRLFQFILTGKFQRKSSEIQYCASLETFSFNKSLSIWWPIKRNLIFELLHCWLGYLRKESL